MTEVATSPKKPAENFTGVIIITDNDFLRRKLENHGNIFPNNLAVKICSENFNEIREFLAEDFRIIIIYNRFSKHEAILKAEGSTLEMEGYKVTKLGIHFQHEDGSTWATTKERIIRSTHEKRKKQIKK